MSRWVMKGLRTGIATTRYPAQGENAPGVSPGLPRPTDTDSLGHADATLTARCPTDALLQEGERVVVKRTRCIHCFRCVRGPANPIPWDPGFEWTISSGGAVPLPSAFQRSLHIRVVDAGGCGACLNEVKLLNNPFYNMHRLGFFITPTPRKADILVVVGPVTEHMKTPLLKAYAAMPTPKRIMAVGACALSGGVFGPGFVAGDGVASMLPVDVQIPGCPPPPLAVLHGLLVLSGRKQATVDTPVAGRQRGGKGR